MNDSDFNPRKRHVVFQKLNITPSSMPIISLIASIKNVRANGLDLSPDYQRGYIWSNEYKDQLILSIILNYPIGNIVINNLDQPNQRNARQELVDGKQRLTTIFRFMEVGNVGQWLDSYDDWFQLSKKTSDQAKEIINRIVGDSDPDGLARMHRAKRLAFSDLPSSIQMNFNTYNIPVYTMQAADCADPQLFQVLQNQEKLRAGEIINALPDNPMSMYFDRIPAEAFLTRTGCSNFKRAELEKVYYSVLGTWFDKIQINASDKTVISFVENMPDLTETQIKHINNLNSGIIAISRLQARYRRFGRPSVCSNSSLDWHCTHLAISLQRTRSPDCNPSASCRRSLPRSTPATPTKWHSLNILETNTPWIKRTSRNGRHACIERYSGARRASPHAPHT